MSGLDELASELADNEERKMLYLDAQFEFGGTSFDEDKGILRVPAVISKVQVYDYGDYKALRSREELEAVVPYVKGAPVTRGHPASRLVTQREEVLGWTTDATLEDDELRAMLEITDKELIEDIRAKRLKEVSPGWFTELDRTASGELNGVHYDGTQRSLFIDHIAIVPKGRCSESDGCGLKLDAEEEKAQEEDLNPKEDSKGDLKEDLKEENVMGTELEAAVKIAEGIAEKAEEGKGILGEVKALKEVPSAVTAKVNSAMKLADTIKAKAKSVAGTGESPAAAKKAEKVVEEIVEKAEDGEKTLKEAKEVKDIPSDVAAKVGKAATVMGSIRSEAKKGVAKLKKAEGEEEKPATSSYPLPEKDEAVEGLTEQVEAIRLELDAKLAGEKAVVIDELCSLQDVRKPSDFRELSLDGLAKELEMVKSLTTHGITFGTDEVRGDGAIKSAYKAVGRKGGKE